NSGAALSIPASPNTGSWGVDGGASSAAPVALSSDRSIRFLQNMTPPPFLFSLHFVVSAVERGRHCMPGERRAFDPRRERPHARQGFQLLEISVAGLRAVACDQRMKAREQRLRFVDRLALD